MRVTDRILSNNFLINLNKNKSNIDRLQRQIETQSKINKPSDSPSGAAKSLRLANSITNNDYYLKNVDNALAFLTTTEGALNAIESDIQTLIAQFPSMSNPTYQDDLDNFADMVDLTLESLLNSANEQFDGKYIFGGTDFSAKPYGFMDPPPAVPPPSKVVELKVPGTVANPGVSGKQIIKISPTMSQQINLTGDEVFGQIGVDDIFNRLIAISDELRAGNLPTTAQLKEVEDYHNDLLDKISQTGNIVNQLINAQETITNQNLELKNLLSKEKDTDIAEAVLEMQNYQFNLDVSYKLSSMILPKSLMDFL